MSGSDPDGVPVPTARRTAPHLHVRRDRHHRPGHGACAAAAAHRPLPRDRVNAEWGEQAGRYDFAEQYKAMEKRVRKGAAFAVTIDPQTGEVLIAA